MIKPKRTAEEYEQSKLGGGKSGNSNSGGSSGLIKPKRTASEFEGYKRGDDAWYSSDEQIRPSTGSGNGPSRLAEAARLKAEGDARKAGRLYSIYSRRLRGASASAQASSARQRYDYYDQQYQALQEQKTGATALAGIGARDLDGKGSEKLKKLKEQRDKWAGYVKQIEAGKSPEIESTPYADWMYAINTDQYGKAAAQGQAQLTQEAIDRRGNYTRNQLEAMRDREAAKGNDIMVNAYDAALGAKADDAKLGVVEAIRRRDDYNKYSPNLSNVKTDTAEVDGTIVFKGNGMTYDEFKTYDYLLHNGSKYGISAGEYYATLRPTLEHRQMQMLEDEQRQMVQSGLPGAIAANINSIGLNTIAGLGYIPATIDAATGGEVTQDRPYFALGRMADAARDATREEIVNGVGGGFGADAAAFAYDTSMSIADFIASYYATGGGAAGKISEAAMLTLMGTRAAESTTRDSLERGATQEQALVNGAAAGIAEVLFEKLSIENFESVKSAMNSSSYIKRVLSQAGVEASEEMCTEIANILTDRAIMGNKSEYEATVEQYRAQGMTLSEAEAQANLDMAKRVGLSGLGGFISGGVTGSFAAAMSAGERSKLGKYVLGNDTALYNTLSYARFKGAEQAGQIATDLADGKITYDEARKAYKGKTRDLGGIFAQMVGDAYATQVARGMTPNAQLGTNPTADDIIAYSNAMFAERANAPIETETETEAQPQEQTQSDRLMFAAQQAAQGQTESVPADLESAARQSVERQETQRQERRAAQIRQTQEQRAAVREGIRTQLDGAVSQAAADAASAAYDGISDVGAYIRATYAIDNAARAGHSLDSIDGNIAAAIPEQTRTAIYNAAVSAYKTQNSVAEEVPIKVGTTAETSAQTATDGDAKEEMQTATATKAQTDIATATEAQTVAEGQETSYTHDASTRGGLVYADGVAPKSKAEANAAKALDIALKAVGITVNVKGDNGVDVVLSDGTVKKGAAYGLYNKSNGGISTEGISLVTILHESVHKIGNEVSAEDWAAFKDAVISAARDAGVDVDAQRQSLEDAYSGIEDSAHAIDEEQIAYIVGQLADKPDLAEHFAARFIKDEQTQSLFKRLIDKIKELLGRIRDALTRRKYYKASEAIATDIDALDKVESAYFDALEKVKDKADRTTILNEAEQRLPIKGNKKTEQFAVTPLTRRSENQRGLNSTQSREIRQSRFELKEPIEQKKDLIAVHNVRAAELEKTLKLGGFPMPSIAVVKDSYNHNRFGEISVLFSKDAIDPENRLNAVYSGDAWTPTYPQIEYKANKKVADRIRSAYYELERKYGRGDIDGLYPYANYAEEQLNSVGGEDAAKEKMYNDTGLMQIYNQENGGVKQEKIYKQTRTELTDVQKAESEYLIKALGKDVIEASKAPNALISPITHRQNYLKQYGEKIRAAYAKFLVDEYGFDDEEVENVLNNTKDAVLIKVIRTAREYLKNGGIKISQEFDENATREAIRKSTDQNGYREWVDSLFNGLQEKSGIRNNQDPYTKSGNRKSFEALHYEETLENVVEAMREQGEVGIGALGMKDIIGSSARKYNSIADIKADKGRLRTVDADTYDAQRQEFSHRFFELGNEFAKKTHEFDDGTDARNVLVEAIENGRTREEIARYLKKEGKGFTNYSEAIVDKLIALRNDIASMPTEYFEAKPQRAVGFDEIKAVVLPKDAPQELKNALDEKGIPMTEYDGTDEGRIAAVNSAADMTDARFELKNPDDAAYMEAVERGDMVTAQQMVDEAAIEAGYTFKAYHGTSRADRVGNIFRADRATSGPMAFFTDNRDIAENYSRDKRDTSLAYDTDYDTYESQFRASTKKGAKYPLDIPVHRAWGYIHMSKRNEIRRKAGQLRFDWDGDGDAFILDPDTQEANGGFQWQLKESGGNVISALEEQWLNSGNLFNKEARFLEVLELVGIKDELERVGFDLSFKDPDYREEKVYNTYLRITKPFDAAKMVTEAFIKRFENWIDKQPYGKYHRESQSADMWDKNGLSSEEFAERMRHDLEKGTSHAWTSIPDSMTDYLKHLHYDGIVDVGGKNGGVGHTVYIPFYSEQIKSADPVTYDDNGNVIPLSERFRQSNNDIRFELKDDSEQLTPYELEYKINGIRKEISELDNESMFASEIKQRSINNKIYKLEEDLSKLVEIERKATKRTPLNVVLDNLSKYRYTDLESIAEQLTDNAWDYDEDISRSELEDGIRQIIEDRAAEMSPIEMQAPKYGVWVRPISDLTQSNSTHFELKDPDDAAYRKLERKNTQLEKKVAALKQELKRTNGMVVKSGEAKKLAAKIVKDYSSSYDKQTLEENLQKTFDFFAAKQEDGKTGLEHFEEAMPQIIAMAEDIINRSSEPIAELEEFYKPIRDMIRKTKITPTEQQKAEIPDWGKFVRENRGKIAIAKEGGVTVLTLYENLVEADPDYFESDIPEEDMLPAIAEYVNNTAAPTYVNPFDEFMDEAVDGLAHEIVGEYLVAPKLKTFADKKFAEKEAALKKQGERLKAKTAAVREAYKAKLAEQKMKAAADKKKLRSDINERQKRKVIKSRIAQRLTKLNRWLKSPEKRAYVPQSLIKSATEAAQFVSEKLSRADYYDSRIPVLEAKIKSAKSAEQKLKYGEYLAKIRKQGDSARDKLNALINSYDEIIAQMKQDEQDTTVKESVVESIKEAREYLGDTAVNKMSSDQLKALEDVLKLVMSDIDYARKEFSGEKAKEAFDLGKRIADNLSEVQNKGDIAIAAKTLNGDRFLRRLGGYAKDNPFDALADKWTDGTRRKIATERDLTGLFDDLVNDKAKMKQLKAMRDEKNAVELSINGEKISLTHAEMINLYGQLNDEDALRHIIYGGETLRRDTKGQKTGRNRRIMPAKIDLGVRAAIEKNSELSGYDKEVLLNELDNEVMAQYEQLKRDIESKMTDYDRAWYKTIRKMFDSVSPALIDEQNLNEFGFRKATQPNYWRIETDKNFVSSEEAWSTLKYDANPANMGFMKKRIRGKKPIVLRDVTEFVDSYIRDTSTYVGMLAPSLYTKRVLSAQDPDRAWSVREALEVYGKTALGTINELMDDNIGLKTNAGSMLMNRLRGGLAQSSLMINPAVSVGQAASFFPAYPYLSAKELAKGLFVKPSSIPEEIMVKYSPYYWTRTKGYSLQQYADVGKDKMSEITQRGKAVLGWITGMDLFTVRRLWMASEAQVKSERPDLEIGTKEQIEKGESPFYKEVAKRYEGMLIRTQPVYAAQQRTGLARSKNEILRSFSMFRTVRDQNFGEVYEAIGRLRRYTQDAKTGAHGTTKEDVKAARKHLAKVIIGQLLSALMLVGLKEIAKLLLDHNADDFKDEYGEIDLGAAAGSLGINFLESLASNVLFGSDIYSLVKSMIDGSTYYGIDVNVTGIANDFLNSVRNITQNFNGTTVYNLAVSVSQILGVPLRNTVKMIEGAAESINDIANGLAGTYASEFDRKNFRMTLNGITPSRLYKAIKDGDSARADKYREVLMGMVNEKGEKKYTTSDIDRAVAKLLAADDDRIKEAYEAKKSKDTETVEKLRGEIVADGFTTDMFNAAIDAYENSLKLEDDEETTEEDKVLETSSYSATELCDAILGGDKDAENGMIDVLKKEGKTGEQIKTDVKTNLKDRYQELYRAEGEKAAVELGKQIISKAGTRYELTNYTINRWAAVVEACDNEDIAAANRKISQIKDKSELGYLKTTLSGYYKREYEVAINTENKERQKELEKQMRNINLYDATTGERYFSSEKLSEWRKEFNF